MNQTQQVLAAISEFISKNNLQTYSIKGYFGFAYLTVKYFDKDVKYKFDYNAKTEMVQCTKEQ